MITIKVDIDTLGLANLVRDFPKLQGFAAWFVASFIRQRAKADIFSNNPVNVITGATRKSVGIGKGGDGIYRVGPGFEFMKIAGKYPGHLGRLQEKYSFIGLMSRLATSSAVSKALDKAIQNKIKKYDL